MEERTRIFPGLANDPANLIDGSLGQGIIPNDYCKMLYGNLQDGLTMLYIRLLQSHMPDEKCSTLPSST
jgi:hypothetical protein